MVPAVTPAVGLLHPGEMGASIGAALVERGSTVVWLPAGRSAATAQRAAAAGLVPLPDLDTVVGTADMLLSVCPPHAALEVAAQVAGAGFSGTYVDANAVAPTTALAVRDLVEAGGARFVDGAVIGGPMRPGSDTRLYVSGPGADEVAALLAGSDRGEAVVLGGDLTAASALKMAYSAWTKVSAALLVVVEAAATTSGIGDSLRAEWSRSQPQLAARLEAAHRSFPKAWRWSGEMDQIATTFADLDLPDGFGRAAAEVWRLVGDGGLVGGDGLDT